MSGQARVKRDDTADRRGAWLLGFAFAFAVAVTAGLIWAAMRLADPSTMPLREVRIEGEFRHLRAAHLQSVVGALVAGGFFTIDVDAVRRGVMKDPWVEEAAVRRVWPDGLLVTITEREPYAYWGDAALLDASGVVFRPPVEEFPPGLIEFAGPEGTAKQVLARHAELERLVAPVGRRVTRLELNDRRAWRFTLAGDTTVIVGRADFEARVSRFVEQYGRTIGNRGADIEQVDLRYTNGFAVRPRARSDADAALAAAQTAKPGA